MKRFRLLAFIAIACTTISAATVSESCPKPNQIGSNQSGPSDIQIAQARSSQPTERSFVAANQLNIKVKEVAPSSQVTNLQIICFFKHKASGDTVIEAVANLDKQLGGVIRSLRDRSEFVGDELETLLFIPPKGSIKPQTMLLIGLGDEQALSLDTMRRIGKVALREAVRLKATRVSYDSAIRDQGNTKLDTGDVCWISCSDAQLGPARYWLIY